MTNNKTPEVVKVFDDGHKMAVSSVCFSPNENEVYSVGMDSNVYVWSVGSKRLKKVFVGHKKWIVCVDCSKNEKFLATGSRDQTIRIWNSKIEDGDSYTLKGHGGDVIGVRFCGNLNLISSGHFDKTAKIWDLELKKCISTFGIASYSCSLDFSKDREMIAIGQFKNVQFFDFRSVKNVFSFNYEVHGSYVNSVHFHPDSNYIATGCSDFNIRLFDVRKQLLLSTKRIYVQSRSVCFHPSGNYLISGCAKGRVQMFSVSDLGKKTGLKEIFCSTKRRGEVKSVQFSESGDLMVSGNFDRSVIVWKSNLPKLTNSNLEISNDNFKIEDENERMKFLQTLHEKEEVLTVEVKFIRADDRSAGESTFSIFKFLFL